MISSAGKAPTCPRHRKPMLPLITGLGQLVLSPVPTSHLDIFLASMRHTGHKYSLFSKPISNSAQEYNWAEFQKPSLLFRRKTNHCRDFYLYCFCALLCLRQRFNLSMYRLSPLIICLRRVWFCLFVVVVVFFSPPFTSLFQQIEKLSCPHVYIECRDNFHNCGTWRRSGLCHGTAHAFYLRNGCAKTCGFCKSK